MKAYCELATTTTDAGRAEPGMGFRLRVRCLCGRPSAQVPDGGGRIHEGRLGDRSRRSYPIGARDRGAFPAGERARRPKHLRSDNGPEFVSRALLKWIADQGIDTALIEPGKPWQNGVNESFNGKFRDECLSLEWFRSRAEAKIVIENWRRHFTSQLPPACGPHSSLDYQTPAEFAAKLKEQTSASIQATGRDAAVYGAFAPRPVAQPPRKGHQEPPARDAVSS